MTKVTITRHYSGFTNVADKFSLGNREHEGDAAATDYNLPEGYEVDETYNVIRDAAGYECAIALHGSGKPQLISRAGPIGTVTVLTEA